MKVKLKVGEALQNNWKSCGCSKQYWDDVKDGKSIDVNSVHRLIKNKVEILDKPVVKPVVKPTKTKGDK